MGFEFQLSKGLALFLAGLLWAVLMLRLFLRWRYATALGRARRIAARLRAPTTTLAAVEDQSSAVEELIEFPDAQAAAAAARELLKENDASVRSAAVDILRQTRTLDQWSRCLHRGGYRVKLRAIEALGEVGDERAAEELLEALADDDPDVARAASHAIVARDRDYACGRLAEALASPNRRLAETAAATLVRMGGEAVDPLVGQLGSPSAQARRLAVESLGSIGEGTVKEVLLPLLETEPDPDVRAAAAEALARVDGEPAAEELRRIAESDPDWFVRARAYSLLAEVDAPEASGFLLQALAEIQPDLGRLSEEGNVGERVGEGKQRIRSAIIAGLRLLGLTEEEIAAAEGRNADATLASEVDTPEDVPAVLASLRDRDPVRRVDAARRLGEIGQPAALYLRQALRDPYPIVRAEAARSLGRTASRESLPSLALALQDPDGDVRLAASTAMGAIVTRDAAQEMRE